MAEQQIILVDIDGTIADATPRAEKYLQKGKEDWDAFYNACKEDKPIEKVIEVIEILSFSFDIVFCSGRRKSCRKDTEEWIKKYVSLAPDCKVDYIFRSDGDKRHDTIVKPEKFAKYLLDHPKTKTFAIFEDRNSMVAKWRELGYTVFQPADGNF
jgi:predicted secreted acid phosphatase